MELMIRTAGKALAGKKDRTAEEDDMLDMMLRGGERVRRENLMEVLEWYHLQEHIWSLSEAERGDIPQPASGLP